VSDFAPALRVPEFRRWWLALLAMGIGMQMLEVAIGWEVYSLHRSPLDLGWIGLAEFTPTFVLALPAGHLADRLPRRLVFGAALTLGAGVGSGLAAVSASGQTSVVPYLALAAGSGTVMALGTPAARAMAPTLVPASVLPNAMALRTVAGQTGQVLGPALGGVLYAASPVLVYSLAAGMCLVAAVLVVGVRGQAPASPLTPEAPRLAGVLEGLRLVRRTPVILGAILLDLLAVLFGGAVALLPVFARSILHVGPAGLGALRAAPAVGALVAAVAITRWPIGRRAGRTLLTVVGVYGVAIIVFGLSRFFLLSLVALAVSGFADLFSVNIRITTVTLATPDRLRGRVSAVEMVFVNASNQLGAFESGLAAFLVGAVPAVIGGGVITVLIAASWRRFFPDLARMDRFQDAAPAAVVPTEG
jgi:MFS family permease